MPTTTERGVTTYHDRDTPPEFATGADEDRHGWNEARDAALAAAGALADLLEELDEPRTDAPHTEAQALDAMSGTLLGMVAGLAKLLGR